MTSETNRMCLQTLAWISVAITKYCNRVLLLTSILLKILQMQITLSGLLNFIDGLWSSCGDERIIVFTTNHKDKLDPALLRPGRMDVHIEMSYCTFSGFRVLASNYLNAEKHRLFKAIEDLFQRVKVTPAEVAGELMKSNNSDVALENLIKFLQNKEHDRCDEKLGNIAD